MGDPIDLGDKIVIGTRFGLASVQEVEKKKET